jgi:redox-sensitive bicupin YhaK (pirin superfamily)
VQKYFHGQWLAKREKMEGTSMKTIQTILRNDRQHWVGDGFPVRSLFSYREDAAAISPFLLLDYGGPWNFEPADGQPRGVGQHPHRGFETVSIVYDGEVIHRDSTGAGGTIGPGDVQWMTAGSGVLHEEFHSPGFSRSGGPLRMAQLWVNLPARDKMAPAAYQSLTRDMIPTHDMQGGRARVIAGELDGIRGPASTFTPINLWDVRLDAGAELTLPLPDGHTALIAVLAGHVTIDAEGLGEGEVASLTREGAGAALRADGDAMLLVLTGEPIDEPVVGYGPFVMNSEYEIRQAIADLNAGKFGALTTA